MWTSGSSNLYAGSVLSGGGSEPLPKATAEDWVNMINGFQKGALASRLGIPMMYGIDAVHGHNNVYNATIFPHNVGLGATRQVKVSAQLSFSVCPSGNYITLVSSVLPLRTFKYLYIIIIIYSLVEIYWICIGQWFYTSLNSLEMLHDVGIC